jgi:hypothetical protein
MGGILDVGFLGVAKHAVVESFRSGTKTKLSIKDGYRKDRKN